MTERLTAEERKAITKAALARGDLRVIMTRTQRKAYALFRSMMALFTIFVVDSTRRWGKTFWCAMLVHMDAMSGPNRIIRYVAPTKLHGRQFVAPAFAWLFAQLPADVRPKFVLQDSTWIWPNGSVCHLGSAETMSDVEAQVGTACHLAVLDEAGKVRSDLLKHLVRSVLRAQFLTTGGNIVVASTPAISAAHYLTELVAEAEANNTLARYTIDDCDHVSIHEREKMIADLGGRQSTEVRRELYCEHVTERTRLIVPEWMDVEAECLLERPVPDFKDWYVVGDLGFEDLSVVLFAWYDFAKHQIVIEDEIAMHQESGLAVGYAVKEKEASLGITNPKRFADGTAQLLADLASTRFGPGLPFGLPPKDDSDAAVNAMRMHIQRKHVVINPRCKVLLSHLRYGIWNARRSDFERQDGFGHWDAIDALTYLLRVVNWKRNPAPTLLPGVTPYTHHIAPEVSDRLQRARATLRGIRHG